MYKEIQVNINEYASKEPEEIVEKKAENIDAAVEEILQLIRKQNSLLNSPELLFPSSYFEFLQRKFGNNIPDNSLKKDIRVLADPVEMTLDRIRLMNQSSDSSISVLNEALVFQLLEALLFGILSSSQSDISRGRISALKKAFRDCATHGSLL